MRYTKDDFPEMVSIKSGLTTVVFSLFAILVFNFAFMFYAIPLMLQLEQGSSLSFREILFDLIYYPLLIWGTWVLWKFYQNSKPIAIKKITVDQNGFHHHLANGTVESVLYHVLEKSTEFESFDIDRCLGSKYRPTYIYGFKDDQQLPIHFSRPANGFTYIPKNKHELIGHFLQGITLFRPDLNISQTVFLDFFIDTKTFEFDKKGKMLFYLVISIVVLTILAGIIFFSIYISKR